MQKQLRVLLDANVWREVCDANVAVSIEATARRRNLDILVAPSVVYEALRTGDPALRRRLAHLMTRPSWTAMMPEAFELSAEVLSEVRRLHPEWLTSGGPAEDTWRRNYCDWQRQPSRGFWHRVRHDPEAVAGHIDVDSPHQLPVARQVAHLKRVEARASGLQFESVDFANAPTYLDNPLPGWGGDAVAKWRVAGLACAANDFRRNPYSDWLGAHLDLDRADFPSGAKPGFLVVAFPRLLDQDFRV